MDLRSLQQAFQARVLAGDDSFDMALAESGAADFPHRIGAYVGGYRSRLVEALATSYPVLRQVLGDDAFDALMHRYVQSMPSRHYSIRYYGGEVPAFIASQAGVEATSVVADIANWEWALAEVFDAADDTPVGADRLTSVAPQAWAAVSFALRASVRVVSIRSNAVQWWRSAQGECDAPAALVAEPETRWLLWRRGLKTQFRSMDDLEAQAIDGALRGADFAELCEVVAREVGATQAPLRSASLLRGWFADELVADLILPPG